MGGCRHPTIYERLPEMIADWQRTAPNGCWIWPFAKVEGYGVFTYQRKGYRAHRYIYEQLVGPVPRELVMDHLCRNHSCVNPAHLEPVTDRENCVIRGQTVTAENARRTHCERAGHALEGDNLYITPSGGRSCRACNTELRRQRLGYKGNLPCGLRTHCRHGHPLSGDNLRLNPRKTFMERVCRTCETENQRRYKERKQGNAA
jgi:hypothetical protein